MLKLLMFKPCKVANILQTEIKKIRKKVEINEKSYVLNFIIDITQWSDQNQKNIYESTNVKTKTFLKH